MKKALIKIFKYLENLWADDGKINPKKLGVLIFGFKLVTTIDWGVRKWDATRSLGDLSSICWIYAAIIGAIWGLGIYNNTKMKEIEANSQMSPNTVVTVEKAETVTNNGSTPNTKKTDSHIETTSTSTPVEKIGD